MAADVRIVRTARLVGRTADERDFDDYARLFADPGVAAKLGGALGRDEARRYFEAGRAHWQAHGFGVWSFHDEHGAFVGRGGLRHCIAGARAEIEIAYALRPEHWGRGLATELARACADVAFGPLALDEIVGFTRIDNLASQRVLQKSGFAHERDGVHGVEPHRFYRLRRAGYFSSAPPPPARA